MRSDGRKDVLFVSQVHERVPLALLLDVLVRPAVLLLLLLKLSCLLDVQAQVDPAQEHRDEQLHGEQDHDGDLARDVRGRVLGLEDLRADDVADAERCQRQGVDSVLCELCQNGGERSDQRLTDLLRMATGVTGVVRIYRRQRATKGPDEVYRCARGLGMRLR